MAFDSTFLQQRLSTLAAGNPASRVVLAFSGGLDSTALLHAAAMNRQSCDVPLLAVHIQHDLHDDADEWQAHCSNFAKQLNLDFRNVKVTVPRDSGLGLEAAARLERYAALQGLMRPGDWLLTAHHQDDQAETLLLNLLRGSGVDGMAGIGEMHAFGPGFIVRPLLDVPRERLLAYAQANRLNWLTDPSNADKQFDRNFLRHEILPLLATRWGATSARLARSSTLASEASELLKQLADNDLQHIGEPAKLEISGLQKLSAARQSNVIRRALELSGLVVAPEKPLRQILDNVIPAKPDASPLVQWAGGEVRRYRDRLYLQAPLSEEPTPIVGVLGVENTEIAIGSHGLLRLTGGLGAGLPADIIQRGLSVRFRDGGEQIRPIGHACSHKLKKLLQQRGVVPWMRDRIPLLYSDDSLVAVADLWIASDVVADDGYVIEWIDRPGLF